MIAVLMNGGRSFKGAASYYLHDKRKSGEATRDTADRIAWTHCVNLATDDPAKAWRMMAHTAMAQGEIKAAAEVKAGGRKLTQPVCSYALSWHEGDSPTQDEQLAAALETLKVLGLDGRQAIIVAHNDTAHPHVHVIANRVSLENGIAAPLNKSKEKLQAWALDYEKARGNIRCDKRAEKAQRRARGEGMEAHPRKPRAAYEAEAATNDNLRSAFIQADQKAKDAALQAATRAMRARHSDRWRQAKTVYQDGKAKLWQARRQAEEVAAEQVREDFKPQWSALFRRQQAEARELARDASTVGGRLKRWFADRVGRRFDGDDGERRGLLSGVFNAAVSGDTLRKAMQRRHEAERRSLAEYRKASICAAQRTIREAHKTAAAQARARYLDLCQGIRREQEGEQRQMRDAWRQRNEERRQALAGIRRHDDRTGNQTESRADWGRSDHRAPGGSEGRGRNRGPGLG